MKSAVMQGLSRALEHLILIVSAQERNLMCLLSASTTAIVCLYWDTFANCTTSAVSLYLLGQMLPVLVQQ